MNSWYSLLSLRARTVNFWQTHRYELILAVLLFAAAILIRLPNLLLVPRYTDEGLEVLWGLDIARGVHFALTAVDAYDGPFFPYLMAALFRIFGMSVALPRVTTVVFDALTIAATYWLGRAMWNRRAGLIAAGFAVTSPALINNSHFGQSNSLTPFFATITVAALYLGVSRRWEWLLALSGLLAALALQTHPLVAVALVGMLLWFLFRRDLGVWLRRRAPWYALGLFLLGYAPMLIANLRPNSPMLAQAENRSYAFAPTLSPEDYLQRLAGVVQHIPSIVGSGFALGPAPFWPGVLVMGVLLLAGLLPCWRRGNGLIPGIFLSTIVLLPIIVKIFVEPWGRGDRYIMFLAPLGFVVIGVLLVASLDTLGAVRPGVGISRSTWRKAGALPVLSAIVILIVYPIRTLGTIYDSAFATGQTNQEFFRLLDVTHANRACDHGLFVQDLITFRQNRVEAWYTVKTIHYLLALDRCRHASQTSDKIVAGLHARGDDGWPIIAEQTLTTYSGIFDLVPVTTIAAYPDAQPGPYVLYRVRPKPRES